MNELTDNELLERFAAGGSEEAFTALVDRHISLVYSAALRAVSNADHAQEITQAVFIVLAHRAGSLGAATMLGGWLYRTARLTAANFRRAEQRRCEREQEAYMISTLEEIAAEPRSGELAPMLDDAMAELRRGDHDALVLRYFENKSLDEVGRSLGVGERAAQKRVGRALDRLRRVFQKRGVVATAAGLAGVISTCSVQAAPAGLAVTVSAAAVQGSAVAGSTLTLVKGTLNIMSWIKTKVALAIGGGILGASVGVMAVAHYHMHHAQPVRIESAGSGMGAGGGGGAGAGGGGGGMGSAGGGGGGMGPAAADAELQEAKVQAERARAAMNVAAGGRAEKLSAEAEAAAKSRTPARSE